ncbi:MAG TPA: LytTR family DNA-binding domain-containing protein [Kofleriaceae bacterium]|nr:LytTR family DNA-binding domain-containing protein [Kofleriaceae bacterium]
MTLRTLVVDDEPPARDRLRRLLQDHSDVEWVGEASSGLEALERIAELDPDLVFLDIQMPEMDGLEVAASIPRPGPAVVFATAYDAHAIRAFELAAVDYLLKPVDKDRLRLTLERVRSTSVSSADLAQAVLARMDTQNQRMAVRSGAKYVVFETARVAAILARDHYATILVDGRELLSEESLDKLMDRLDRRNFMRVHRGAILNLAFVQELQQEGDRKYVALLAGVAGIRVPISREKLDEVKARLGIA